jgi:hypothetical protein
MATTDVNLTEQAVWYLVFTRATTPHTIHWWLDKEFQHVFAMKRTPGRQFWQILEPTTSHTCLTLESTDVFPTPWDYYPHATDIVGVHVKYDRLAHNKHLGFSTCVDAMKAILGIKHTLCLTPYQLYINLLGDRYEQRITTWREAGKGSRTKATTVARGSAPAGEAKSSGSGG